MQVMDLSEGHVSALQYIQNAEPARNTYSVFNLGKGQGYSVLDMVRTMQEASGREIKTEFADRRPGDIAICYADPAKATKELHWTAKRSLEDSCRGTYLRYKYTFLSVYITTLPTRAQTRGTGSPTTRTATEAGRRSKGTTFWWSANGSATVPRWDYQLSLSHFSSSVRTVL
jgi:hypothetical protein